MVLGSSERCGENVTEHAQQYYDACISALYGLDGTDHVFKIHIGTVQCTNQI